LSRPLRVLLVEDCEGDAALLVRELARCGYAPDALRVETAEGLAAALHGQAWDLVLCDYTLPELDAPTVLQQVHASGLDVPFIIVSGTIGEERAVESMHAGAHDFILKDRLARLGPAVEREVNEAALRAEQAKMREQLRRSEITLARSEKLRALGQMAAGITHDLKNLLSPLSLHLQVLDRSFRRGILSDAGSSIDEMKQILDRGIRTIERLRELSRQSPEREPSSVDLNQVAREATELARPHMSSGTRAMCAIVLELAEPPQIPAQADEVVSAIVNLVINAIDAMPAGGSITLRTGEERGGAWIEVADDGPGMTPEVEQRVFEPFFSTKGPEGTGLGLAMVYACAVRHAGAVTLKTAPGEGARFRLWFPMTAVSGG
jgi:signal transduction histidine kinase